VQALLWGYKIQQFREQMVLAAALHRNILIHTVVAFGQSARGVARIFANSIREKR
jgi:hypothetical protein